MCGIAGFYCNDKIPSEAILADMTQTLKHRGPDAGGIYIDGKCGLGHRRLSIVDLTSSANQPMTSQCGRYIIAYNGEVYNYRELIEKYFQESNRTSPTLKTKSDTEVILELFCMRGEAFVEDLNGMFAIAIYDQKTETLHLFRDRIGIKPIFYYWDGKSFYFASEMKAILIGLEVKPKINVKSISSYLGLGFIPAPDTIYENIFKLQPGNHLLIQKNRLERKAYWSIGDHLEEKRIKSLKEAKTILNGLIVDSVKLQLRSDVSNGVFLSSGIDSSLITAKAVQVSSDKIKSFSLGFKDNPNDESVYARIIANRLGTEHHEIIITEKDAIDSLNEALDLYEEPNADASIIPTLLLSRFAKQNISVALSGEGADELFLGYGRYKWAKRLDSNLKRFIGQGASYALTLMSSRYKRIGQLLDLKQSRNITHHIFSQEQYNFNDKEVERLLAKDYTTTNSPGPMLDSTRVFSSRDEITSHDYLTSHLDLVDRQAIFDQLYYLPDDLLTKIDRATMKHSLEARVPFLDHRIIEFALNIDNNLKIRKNTSKFLLKEILFEHLPSSLYDRPKKGFSIPLKKWLNNEMRFLITDYLNKKSIEETAILDYKFVEKLIADYDKGDDYLGLRIWLLIVLQHWLLNNKSKYTN